MDTAPAAPRHRLSWSSVRVRAVVALGAWLAVATFFYAITPARFHTSDQAVVMLAWGLVGVALASLWHATEGPLARYLTGRIVSVRRRKVIAFALYMAFVIVMMGSLWILDTSQGGSDWSTLALIAFFAALAVPTPPFLSRLATPVPPPSA